MINIEIEQLDIFSLEEIVLLATAPAGIANYDFAFDRFFACRRPWQRPELVKTISRFGITTNYAELYNRLLVERLGSKNISYPIVLDVSSWYNSPFYF